LSDHILWLSYNYIRKCVQQRFGSNMGFQQDWGLLSAWWN
jgi:hypothetical protein